MDYKEYLNSDNWRKIKSKALDYYGNSCVLCGVNTNISVHHRNYKNLYKETVFDLVVLCNRCHKFVHQKLIDTSPKSLEIQDFFNQKESDKILPINEVYVLYSKWCEGTKINPVRFERFHQTIKRMYKHACLGDYVDKYFWSDYRLLDLSKL